MSLRLMTAKCRPVAPMLANGYITCVFLHELGPVCGLHKCLLMAASYACFLHELGPVCGLDELAPVGVNSGHGPAKNPSMYVSNTQCG